jgi:hypothetical protein
MSNRKSEADQLRQQAEQIRRMNDFFILYRIWINNPVDCTNQLSNNILMEYSQKETTNANDIYYSVRFGKRYKYSRCKVKLDLKHWQFHCLTYGSYFNNYPKS